MYKDLSIVLIVKEDKEFVDEMLKYHIELLDSEDVIVIDSGGGEALKHISTSYEKINLSLGKARRYAISKVKNKYTLIVDVDTELPEYFIDDAMEILKRHKDTAVVAIDYNPLQGHLAMGASLWRTEILKEVYNWDDNKNGRCECVTNWGKVRKKGWHIETLTSHAVHYGEEV